MTFMSLWWLSQSEARLLEDAQQALAEDDGGQLIADSSTRSSKHLGYDSGENVAFIVT